MVLGASASTWPSMHLQTGPSTHKKYKLWTKHKNQLCKGKDSGGESTPFSQAGHRQLKYNRKPTVFLAYRTKGHSLR